MLRQALPQQCVCTQRIHSHWHTRRIRQQNDPKRIRVVRLDATTTPATLVCDVYNPIRKNSYDINIDSAPTMAAEAVTRNIDRTAGPICQRLNTPVDNMLVLRFGGFDDDDINIGNPGLDRHTAINTGKSGGPNSTVSGGSGYMIQTTAGDSDPAWFELTGVEEMRTVTLGIRPE